MVSEGDGLVILEETLTEEPYAFAFAFGSESLVEAIDKVVKDMIASGEMKAIFEAYGESYVAP
jgi:ABC-type amino acid transport substrate-binding protein